MLNAADLPNDIEALKALLLASERQVQEREEQMTDLREQLNTRAVEIEHLKLQIAILRRMQFGRKSEKLDRQIEQLELQLEDLQADEEEAEREAPQPAKGPRARAEPVRIFVCRGHEIIPKGMFHDRYDDHEKT
jgi:transposase